MSYNMAVVNHCPLLVQLVLQAIKPGVKAIVHGIQSAMAEEESQTVCYELQYGCCKLLTTAGATGLASH
jgi:hypothetical protein